MATHSELKDRIENLELKNEELRSMLGDFECGRPYWQLQAAVDREYVNSYLMKEKLDKVLLSSDVVHRAIARLALAALDLMEKE